MKLPASFVIALLAGTSALSLPAHLDAPLTIDTTSGKLTGFINSTAPSVRQFLSVPYAEPPLKSLGYKPPQRRHIKSSITANKYAPSCMQAFSKAPTVYTEHLPQFLTNGGNSEDCLYLNVYAPLKPTTKRLPAFIYIPGGDFTGGGADSLYKIPDKWIEKTKSHISCLISDSGSPGMLVKAFGNHTDFDTLAAKVGCEMGDDQLKCAGSGTYNESGQFGAQTSIGLNVKVCPVAAEVS
ncbi:hypothetical protein ACLX1H_010246 [Fusarium chlamydosporum]